MHRVHIHTGQENTHMYKMISLKRKEKVRKQRKEAAGGGGQAGPAGVEVPSGPAAGRVRCRLTHQLQQLIQGLAEDSKRLLAGKGLWDREQFIGNAYLLFPSSPNAGPVPLKNDLSPLCRPAGRLEPAENGVVHQGP